MVDSLGYEQSGDDFIDLGQNVGSYTGRVRTLFMFHPLRTTQKFISA